MTVIVFLYHHGNISKWISLFYKVVRCLWTAAVGALTQIVQVFLCYWSVAVIEGDWWPLQVKMQHWLRFSLMQSTNHKGECLFLAWFRTFELLSISLSSWEPCLQYETTYLWCFFPTKLSVQWVKDDFKHNPFDCVHRWNLKSFNKHVVNS